MPFRLGYLQRKFWGIGKDGKVIGAYPAAAWYVLHLYACLLSFLIPRMSSHSFVETFSSMNQNIVLSSCRMSIRSTFRVSKPKENIPG